MDKDRKFVPVPVGASSLLVIFAVLCLTVFALLSVSTVQAERRLSDRAADGVVGYYEADCAAEEILARLRMGEIPEGVTGENGVYSYTCPISRTRTLAVSVAVEDGQYTILRWQAVSNAQWESDDSLRVWGAAEESWEEAS